MRHSARILLFAATMAATVILVACADDEEISPSPSPGAGAETDTPTATARPTDAASPSPILPTFTPEPETSPTPVPGVDPGISQEFLRLIIDKDAERRPGQINPVERLEVEVIASEPMTWPDQCLGLADPGLCEFPPETVHGYRITLGVSGFEDRETLIYHVWESQPEYGNGFALLAGPENAEEIMVAMARESLARDLSVNADDVDVVEAREVIFRNGCLDMPEDELCNPVFADAGFKILLSAGGKTYEYRSDRAGFGVVFAGEVE